PELIPVTYAKLRAEFARELDGSAAVSSLILNHAGDQALIETDSALPAVTAGKGEPLWRAALRDARDRGARDAELLGWAGESRAGSGRPTLLIRAEFPDGAALAPQHRLVAINELMSGSDAPIIRDALQRLNLANGI
ncbi:MAG: hypothetical protein ACRDJC_25550, partial [Thermomicrobiales bacterium]